jgi:hypothetical protein
MKNALTLHCRPPELMQDAGQTRWRPEISVAAPGELLNPKYELLCAAIQQDIQTAAGSGATALEEIRRIEAGEIEKIESDGNAWVTYITRDKVWFEGLYSQGEGGEVSFAQYKLAVQTYVRFLSDPEFRPIEVPFPVE